MRQSLWSKIKHKYPQTSTLQSWLDHFQSLLNDIFLTTQNMDIFRLFLRDMFDFAKPKPFTRRRQENTETQIRIVLYRRHLLDV